MFFRNYGFYFILRYYVTFVNRMTNISMPKNNTQLGTDSKIQVNFYLM